MCFHSKNKAQKVRKCCTFLVDYFPVTMLRGNKSYTVGKPVYFPNKWCHICKEHAFMGRAAEYEYVGFQIFSANAKRLILPLTIAWCLVDWMIEV